MKSYQTYKGIRKEAVLLGLSIKNFLIFSVFSILGLLVLFTSFSWGFFIMIIILIPCFYLGLLYFGKQSDLLMNKPFPGIINKKSIISAEYEAD